MANFKAWFNAQPAWGMDDYTCVNFWRSKLAEPVAELTQGLTLPMIVTQKHTFKKILQNDEYAGTLDDLVGRVGERSTNHYNQWRTVLPFLV